MDKVNLYVNKLATGTEQVTFDESINGKMAFISLRVQCPEFDFIGERTVNLPIGINIELVLEDVFNPQAFEVIKIKGNCIYEACSSPEYMDGPQGWPYICAECPYHHIEALK